eukprot:TRINITY_DN5709_c0_g1_i1.p1 TRINITY_DN5709_c0_g1~~TRINITY_DN5709_c0_g1_i1.p1  ORF type:complete len:1902 (+),score=308.18 TRINITY_DN5709_c0_g1_i1:193-5898(+)
MRCLISMGKIRSLALLIILIGISMFLIACDDSAACDDCNHHEEGSPATEPSTSFLPLPIAKQPETTWPIETSTSPLPLQQDEETTRSMETSTSPPPQQWDEETTRPIETSTSSPPKQDEETTRSMETSTSPPPQQWDEETTRPIETSTSSPPKQDEETTRSMETSTSPPPQQWDEETTRPIETSTSSPPKQDEETTRSMDISTSPPPSQRATRDMAKDAQFLMQASFGPTRSSLMELSKTNYTAWIQQQMALPVELHRVYFRTRVNPRLTSVVQPGKPKSRCEAGSRWHRFAFSAADIGKRISIKDGTVDVEGFRRTDLDPSRTGNALPDPNACADEAPPWWVQSCDNGSLKMWCRRNDIWSSAKFCRRSCYEQGLGYEEDVCSDGWSSLTFRGYVCSVQEAVGGHLALSNSSDCSSRIGLVNPAIWFKSDRQVSQTTLHFDTDALSADKVLLKEDSPSCGLEDFINVSRKYYMHDPRLELLSNTLKEPAMPTAGTCHPMTAKTFLNKDSCRLQESSCLPLYLQKASFTLNIQSLKKFHSIGQTYVYEIMGLRTTASPCNARARWRWENCSRMACTATNMSASDAMVITAALGSESGWLRDVTVACSDVPPGAMVRVKDDFFLHVHEDEHSVYDFTSWARMHPGGSSQITKWAANDFAIRFPAQHGMERWAGASTRTYLHYLGKIGDVINFQDLPASLMSQPLADAFNAEASLTYFEACGSPGEVANVPAFGHLASFYTQYANNDIDKLVDLHFENARADSVPSQDRTKWSIWLIKALTANDQLRQRMAWALSQIFVVGVSYGNGAYSEMWLNYYDIFLRHGLGNFRNILREVTYSPLMGGYLTYMRNSAYDYDGSYPDENYAREVMQLFTIGLWKLNPDGSRLLDASGNYVPTYDNEDIMNLARVFTGFDEQLPRSNIEEMQAKQNIIDPMRMQAKWHDVYPKPDLENGFLGDGYPLCEDLSAAAFLAKGARYEFVGYQHDLGSSGLLVAENGSAFFNMFCKSSSLEKCAFELSIQLNSTTICQARECQMSSSKLKVVKIRNAFYRYVPPTCVELFLGASSSNNDTHKIRIGKRGKISMYTDANAQHNQFAVHWQNGFPTVNACPEGACFVSEDACVCEASVEVVAVFDQIPSKSQALSRLKVASFHPGVEPTDSNEDVRMYTASGVIDADTVFEVDGKLLKNSESLVHVGDTFFRNPPVFMRKGEPSTQAALAEVESLLDHLFFHPNTPVFISYRLIQRFVTSNPSPDYIKDVGTAFRTGSYNGLVYSGEYGDLAATLSAILLHPEAHTPQAPETHGSLREPLLKLVHFLRAMEYEHDGERDIVLKAIDSKIGQLPYASPTVFNYYHVDYQPPRFSGDVVAPEFEILTPPFANGLLNGLISITSNGLSGCEGGFGQDWQPCKQGRLNFTESGTPDETFVELDLLLTGGRMSSSSKDVVRAAYHAARQGEQLQAAQQAIVMTPEFHTLGNPLEDSARSPVELKARHTPSSYKALVMLFMAGGADTFNMLVPLECKLYEEYVAVRKDIALQPQELHEISVAGQACGKFGIHGKLPFLKKLYDEGKASFVTNIGSLAEPLTKEQFEAASGKQCAGLFSHSDQTIAAQTLQCQTSGSSPKGAGGRLADKLASRYSTTSFSLAGTSIWAQGFETQIEIIDKRSGSVRLRNYVQMQTVIENITSRRYRNLYCEEFVQKLAETVRSSQELGDMLDAVELKTSYPARTDLAEQLLQVAKLIATREARKAERDFFFVQLGGFDTHSYANSILGEKFDEINEALRDFVQELEAQDIFGSTLVVTESDFGRTLTSNGAGTDHAWSGNHVILGGSVNGGRVLNEFPRSLLGGNDQDAGRGRLIPQYPWESVMVPIAGWMGADSSMHEYVFPNLANFNRSAHIITYEHLFKD